MSSFFFISTRVIQEEGEIGPGEKGIDVFEKTRGHWPHRWLFRNLRQGRGQLMDGWETHRQGRFQRLSYGVFHFQGRMQNTECPKDRKASLKKASSNVDVWGRTGDPSCFLLDWSLTTIQGQRWDHGPTQGVNVSAALLQGTSERVDEKLSHGDGGSGLTQTEEMWKGLWKVTTMQVNFKIEVFEGFWMDYPVWVEKYLFSQKTRLLTKILVPDTSLNVTTPNCKASSWYCTGEIMAWILWR